MFRRIACLSVLLWLGEGAARAAPPAADRSVPLRFFALGDLPYRPSEMASLRQLLRTGATQGSPFLIHLGDIKGGSTPCTDAGLAEIADLFRIQPVPVVYSVGDNEWTDCHRRDAGGLDPRVRLQRVRTLFFHDRSVLRLDVLAPIRADPGYPEIYAFRQGEVLLVALHVVGSNNGFAPADPAAVAEFRARDAVNRRFVERLTASPAGRTARAMVLIVQANPLFESGAGPEGFRGFKSMLADLMGTFPGPVLVLHGDTHRFRQDRPLLDRSRGVPFERLVRVEVPGSPLSGGVWIAVDPEAAEPFVAKPVYAAALDPLQSP